MSESTYIIPITPNVSYQAVEISESSSFSIANNDHHNHQNHPSTSKLILILVVICLIGFNNFFCYHAPSAIASEYESYYHLNTRQFGTLFTIYSAPNIILVFFSGQFIDAYGLKRSSLLFNYIILLGMLIAACTPFFISSSSSSSSSNMIVYIMLLISRLLLGLGGESICACASTMISKWFSAGHHLNLAMAVNQAAFQLIGSAAAFYILPRVNNIIISQWITVSVCIISLLANYLYNEYETYYDDYLCQQQHILQLRQDAMIDDQIKTSSSSSSSSSSSKSIFAVIFEFPVLYYILLCHIALTSPILYTFTAFGPLYLQQTFPSCSDPTVAGDAISLLYMSIIAAPVMGMIIDYIGYRSYIQFFASCMIPCIFYILTIGYIDPKLAMIWMGLIYSITESNGFALIALIVPQELTGTAFGILGCCISISLLIEPAAVGWIFQATGSFELSIWIFFYLTLFGAIFALLLIIYDKMHGNLVSKSNRVSS